MKLMVVTPYFYPKIGGMESYSYNISKGLKDKFGWKIVVVTSNHIDNKYRVESIDGMKIYRLRPWLVISNTPINPWWYFQIKKIVAKERPDVINAHSPVVFISDIVSLVKGRVPLITTYHSGSMLKSKGMINFIIRVYEKFFLTALFKRSKNIICVSSDYIKRKLSTFKNKVVYIPPGVDINLYKPSPIKPINDVLYVGRIEKNSDWKGIKYLLEAIKLIRQNRPEITLRLVGSGDRIDFFKKYAEDLGIENNITFVGSKSGKALVTEYQKSKLLVLPSYTESESFGMVLIEAMACGKPVVGSNIGGIPSVIDDKVTGLLVQPKNPEDIARAVVKILSNPSMANKMGQLGMKKVSEQFTWDKQINLTFNIFEK